MKHIVVLTGAGISAESGLQTFRGNNGLWNGYKVMEVASPEGWQHDYKMVLEFYNLRRQEIGKAKPNAGHKALAQLQEIAEVTIITQNIDDLHERAGSTNIIHLHGEIVKARSTIDESLLYDIGYKNIEPGDNCEKNSQLRPHIVWFGEAVPMINKAAMVVQKADIVIVVGTSLQVYPAAGLLDYAPRKATIYLVDPYPPVSSGNNIKVIENTAALGLPKLIKELAL
ncbi:MAG: NAD-dependent deacylase [Bacteroidota bacterium]|nr:NAD-dependent deacylase [Bacteroidota bacterium]